LLPIVEDLMQGILETLFTPINQKERDCSLAYREFKAAGAEVGEPGAGSCAGGGKRKQSPRRGAEASEGCPHVALCCCESRVPLFICGSFHVGCCAASRRRYKNEAVKY
jgi:hypothetical protein